MSHRLYNEQHLQKVDIAHFLAAPIAFYKNYFRIILRVFTTRRILAFGAYKCSCFFTSCIIAFSASTVQMCHLMDAVDADFVFILKTIHRCFFDSSVISTLGIEFIVDKRLTVFFSPTTHQCSCAKKI